MAAEFWIRLEQVAGFAPKMQQAIADTDFVLFDSLMDERQLLLTELPSLVTEPTEQQALIQFIQSLLQIDAGWTTELQQLHNAMAQQLRQMHQGKRAITHYTKE